jgi:protein O-GlcNAc transferase
MDDGSRDSKQKLLRRLYKRQSDEYARRTINELERKIAGCLAALAENDHEPGVYIKLASYYEESKRHEESLSTLQIGLRRCDPAPGLYRRTVDALAACNRTREAVQVAEEASHLLPDDSGLRLRAFLLLPILYDSIGEIEYYRERFQLGLEKLHRDVDLSSPEARKRALDGVAGYTPFYLAYQGREVLQFQRQYGALVSRIMSANYPQWIQRPPMPPVPADGKLRIGYASAHFHSHSVTHSHLGWLRDHDRKRIEVYAYSMGAEPDKTTELVREASTRFWQYEGDFEAACRAILDDELHVLVHLDIGMDPIMAQLAALRLAPAQCMTWGHPVTSGLPAVEYFFSSDLMEPKNGDAEYSEKLIRLPGIGISYEKPVIPNALFYKNRSDFGLGEDRIVYLSCQSTFKYLPQHDHVFAEIASQVPNSQFAFLIPNQSVGRDFMRRLERAFSSAGLKAAERCALLPKQDGFSYWNLSVLSDVNLDAIEWSGCNTTMEAIACKLPVVALPGRFMRGRHSYAMLTQLGVTETIARDKKEFVSIAVRLGLDKEWRQQVVNRMVAGYPRLYSDPRSVEALEQFYRRVVEERQKAGGS